MSGALLGGALALGAAGAFSLADQLGDVTGNAILILPPRQIGILMPHVTIEESHRDDLVITEHPVEQGASITDHAFKRPPELLIKCGWSNSGYGEGYVQAVYEAILDLQASRVPFVVITGKRAYEDMLIASIATTTDQATEKALLLTVALKKIIIVQTQETTTSTTANQADPSKTGPVENTGTKQTVPVAAGSAPAMLGHA